MLNAKSKLVVSFLIIIVGMLIGRIFSPSIDRGWYDSLIQPPWLPPGYIFGPVWFVLYILLAVSFWLYWKQPTERSKKWGYILFFAQLVINFSWSPVFFGFHLIHLATWMIAAMIVLVFFMSIEFCKVSKLAGWLQVPYFLWLCFAFSIALYLSVYN